MKETNTSVFIYNATCIPRNDQDEMVKNTKKTIT